MNRACFATCLLCCLATFANAKDPSVSFELRTDRNIPYNEWNDVSAVENNVLVAIENGVVVDRFTTKEAEIIEMLSVDDGTVKIRVTENRAFTPGPSAPHWSKAVILFSYSNKKLTEILCYPEDKGNQSGPNIKLLEAEVKGSKAAFAYSYQQYGDAKYAGYGTIRFELQKLKDGYYYVTDYTCDVKGYFKDVGLSGKEGTAWVPDKDGKEIVERDISKMEFFGLFPAYRSVIVYDTAVVGKVCRVYESLRLRADENMSSSIMRTMKAGEYVRVLEVGKKETIDEIPGNWCYVEMVRPKYERDLKTNVEPTGVKGWCFSGYLK